MPSFVMFHNKGDATCRSSDSQDANDRSESTVDGLSGRAGDGRHIGAVLVGDAPGLAGIITDRDLALAVLGGGLDAKTTPLGEVMSEDVITCEIGADLDEVVCLTQEHGVRRVPLVEGKRPVGLITFDDLVVDGSLGDDTLRNIVTAQLEVEAPQKPAGISGFRPQRAAMPPK